MLDRYRTSSVSAGVALATAAVLGVGLLAGCSSDHRDTRSTSVPASDPGGRIGPRTTGDRPAAALLSAYRSCDALLAGLRKHTAAHANQWGLPGSGVIYDRRGVIVPGAVATKTEAASPEAAAGAGGSAPDAHSTTNNQEQGVDEPDTVETDGKRVVSVADGTLRVMAAATGRITGTLDLSMYAGADSAQLFMSGDRVLVLIGAASYDFPASPAPGVDYGPTASGATAAILVDIGHAPSIVRTFHTPGGYVSARMVGGTVRIVVRSTPVFSFPVRTGTVGGTHLRTAYRKVIGSAPLSAWLPTYTLSAGGTSQQHTVPCGSIQHPTNYAGTSVVTVYTIGLASRLREVDPISIVADGATAYASTQNLYLASSSADNTQLHRFDITGAGRPTYLGSATVPGIVADSYSMSQYRDSLRVVTTIHSYSSKAASAMYVVDARTLRTTGHVSGLGQGEQLHAVRFLGPLAYVVTFESVDPLYVLDLSDPKHPRKAGELIVTGYSDYLHPTSNGRLLGVGQSVRTTPERNQMVNGVQVSLFDIRNPGKPRRLDRVIEKHTPSETPIDPHAFLYWLQTGTAVIPINSWDDTQSGAALVLHVDRNGLRTVGTIRNPAGTSPAGTGIERTLVLGSTIWTVSSGGIAISDLHTLHRRAWIAFS